MSDSEADFLRNENNFKEDYESVKSDFDEPYNEQHSDIGDDSDDVGNNESDGEIQREKSELELIREEGINRRNEILKMIMSTPEYTAVMATAEEAGKALQKAKASRFKVPRKDPSFRYTGFAIPLEKRRSSRLQNIPPVFFKEDLIDETEISRKRKRSQDYDYYDLEAIIYQPKKSRAPGLNTVRTPIIPVEEVTDDMIAKIARKVSIKVYSDAGTSCHQCRQKTKDQKTCCRNINCVGVRGQFCGVCLENRYGEDAAIVLKDPQWNCPVCRGICNCSFCRLKAGKRPTGILTGIAHKTGHKSVKEYLESLKGEGDYAHQDSLWRKLNDPKSLLGFSKDIKFAHMGRHAKHEIKYFLDLEKLKKYIWDLESKLESMQDLYNDPIVLIGFFEGTNTALLGDGTHHYMGPNLRDQTNQKKAGRKEIVEISEISSLV